MWTAVGSIRAVWSGFLDFVFPPTCSLCGTSNDSVICTNCASNLKSLDRGYCPSCKKVILEHMHGCPECADNRPVNFIRPLAHFDNAHRQLIHLLKYSGIVDIANFFGERMGKMILSESHFEKYDLILSVPLHKRRHRERTYNQAELLAIATSETCMIQMRNDVICRIKNTESQAKLSAKERKDNVAGAFAVLRADVVCGRSVIIIDDVVTTGATTSEIATELRKAGAKNICVVCVAHPSIGDSASIGI